MIDATTYVAQPMFVVTDWLLPCHLHLLILRIVELGRGPGGGLIGSVSIWSAVTAILLLLPLLTLLLIVLLIAVVARARATYPTVPRVLAKAHVQVEQVVACAPVPSCNVL